MERGIVDHYILPPAANAMSVSLGLDLAGPELDNEVPDADQAPLLERFALSRRGAVGYPARANIENRTTAVVVQNAGDGIEDGHEVFFQWRSSGTREVIRHDVPPLYA
jgi:hypothetical protein